MSAVESIDGKSEALFQYKNRFMPSVKRETLASYNTRIGFIQSLKMETPAFYPRAEDILIIAVILPPRRLFIPSAISLEKAL